MSALPPDKDGLLHRAAGPGVSPSWWLSPESAGAWHKHRSCAVA